MTATLVLASGNRGKVREVQQILGLRASLLVLPVDHYGLTFDPVESGTSFLENARIKALEAWRLLGKPVISDDSGLCVKALGGAPGVHSARYAGEGASDQERYEKLLAALEAQDERRAHFSCVVCAILPPSWLTLKGEVVPPSPAAPLAKAEPAVLVTFEGRLGGTIARAPRGSNGFGFDPIFEPEGFGGRTLAELFDHEKNACSHRAKALIRFAAALDFAAVE